MLVLISLPVSFTATSVLKVVVISNANHTKYVSQAVQMHLVHPLWKEICKQLFGENRSWLWGLIP